MYVQVQQAAVKALRAFCLHHYQPPSVSVSAPAQTQSHAQTPAVTERKSTSSATSGALLVDKYVPPVLLLLTLFCVFVSYLRLLSSPTAPPCRGAALAIGVLPPTVILAASSAEGKLCCNFWCSLRTLLPRFVLCSCWCASGDSRSCADRRLQSAVSGSVLCFLAHFFERCYGLRLACLF